MRGHAHTVEEQHRNFLRSGKEIVADKVYSERGSGEDLTVASI